MTTLMMGLVEWLVVVMRTLKETVFYGRRANLLGFDNLCNFG